MKYSKLFTTGILSAAAAVAMMACDAKVETKGDTKYRPTLFKQFGDVVNLPDGLTQDAEGNIFMAAPNLIDKNYAGVVMKRCVKTGKWSVFCAGAISPKTGRGCPMGIEMGPDGNLYYCDNQYFLSKDYASRVMRVVIDPKTKEALRIETVVENIKLANAIRFYDDALLFTDTYFDMTLPNNVGLGGIYRVPLADIKDKSVSLLKKEDYKKDPYLLGVTETIPLPHRGGDNSGADGLCADKDGNLYVGTFGSGRFYTLKRTGKATWSKPELLFDDPAKFPCCDGITYDAKNNRVIIADSEQNAIRTWDIEKKELGLLWSNGDTDGADGLLDQPCEPMIWQGKLVIVNFDMSFPGLINKENDKIHTLSIMDL